MCAIPDKATTDRFRARKGCQRAWKVILTDGQPVIYGTFGDELKQYRPGRNVDLHRTSTYAGYLRTLRGLHCYVRRRDAKQAIPDWAESRVLLPVTYDPADVIVAEPPGFGSQQVVVRALHISVRAWKQAGLPTKDGGA